MKWYLSSDDHGRFQEIRMGLQLRYILKNDYTTAKKS